MNPLTRPPTSVGILRNFFVPPDFKYSRRSLEVNGSRSTSSQATGAPEKNSSRSPGSSFQDEGFLMNGCSGSPIAKFVPSAHARKTSASFNSSNNQRITLCAPRRRPIVLNICPRNLSGARSEEHTSELQSRNDISYAVFCLKKKKTKKGTETYHEALQKHNCR